MHLKVLVYTCVQSFIYSVCYTPGGYRFNPIRPHLLKGDPVELSLKDVDFLHIVILAANEVALPCKGQLCILSAL